MSDDTRNVPPRIVKPRWGWDAWGATLGYIAQRHSPDALLKIEIYPMESAIFWAATLSWGVNEVSVRDCFGLAIALSELWPRIEYHYPRLLDSPTAEGRKPTGYGDEDWLDERNLEMLSRLASVTETVFRGEWSIVIIYRPTDDPAMRYQSRLVARGGEVRRGGGGANLREGCRALLQNATPDYTQRRKDELE